jgi:uncharacterized protein (TIGR03435 family)
MPRGTSPLAQMCYFYSIMKTMPIAPFVVACVLATPLQAQTPSSGRLPAFEVASVKPNKGDGPVDTAIQGSRVTMVNVPLRLLIRMSFQVQDDQIVDAPNWVGTEHFDVLAKAPDDVPPPTLGRPGPIQLMMQSLLTERFKLVVHHETREAPAYALERARRDGRPGPQLRASTTDCAAITAAQARGATPSSSAAPLCGIRASGGRMLAGGQSMSQVAVVLSQIVRRTVLDRTDLSGSFDFEMRWTPDQTVPAQPGAPVTAADPNGPSIFTALQEQLGLKLEAIKVPIDVLVIDRVERPLPD